MITPTQLQQVKQAFADSGFEHLVQKDCEVDDLPSFALGLRTESGFKELHAVNVNCNTQEEVLYELITRIEHIAHAERWLGPLEYHPSVFISE